MADTKEKSGFLAKVDTYFSVSARGSSFGQEIRGGLTTFFTMAYIVVLNPIILVGASGAGAPLIGNAADEDAAIAKVAAATALVAGVMTIIMGVYGRFPLALAAGLGINSMVAYGLVVGHGLTWREAMGLVVLQGLVVLVLVLTKLRLKILHAVPLALKKAIAIGIGLFLAFIGLWDAGIVRQGAGTPTSFGDGGSISTLPMVVFFVGLLVGAVLLARKVKGALLISIATATLLAVIVEAIAPQQWALVTPTFSGQEANFTPDLGLLGQFSLFGAFGKIGVLAALLLVFSLLVVDFFDTMGTMTAVGEEAGLNDAVGVPTNSQEILIVDSVGAIAGGAASVSSNTAYIESASGVGDGARTGLSSVVTGLAFLLAMFLTPLYALVPFEAATPVLVIVGFLMVAHVAEIDWKDYRIAIPAFLTIIIMPFGFSIAAGIGVGFIAYVVLQAATGRIKEIKLLMWIVAAAFALYFALGPISNAIG